MAHPVSLREGLSEQADRSDASGAVIDLIRPKPWPASISPTSSKAFSTGNDLLKERLVDRLALIGLISIFREEMEPVSLGICRKICEDGPKNGRMDFFL
jgi:hypothetical protein